MAHRNSGNAVILHNVGGFIGSRKKETKKPLTTKAAKGLGASAHRRLGYPSPGCVPAEPDSVSPGDRNLPPKRLRVEREAGIGRAIIRTAKPRPTAKPSPRRSMSSLSVCIAGDTASAARREVLPTRKTNSKCLQARYRCGTGANSGMWPRSRALASSP